MPIPVPRQRLVLDDGGRYPHVREKVEESDDNGGDGHYAEVVGRKETCQYTCYDERDDDAAVFGQCRVEYS